jgi:GNAT superfamily N-acetyltransferase
MAALSTVERGVVKDAPLTTGQAGAESGGAVAGFTATSAIRSAKTAASLDRTCGPPPVRSVTWLLQMGTRAFAAHLESAPMGEIVIRQAGDADMQRLMELRSVWTREWHGDADDPGYAERFAAWFERESGRRLTWLAEADGRAIGMMNLAVFERMPSPGREPGCWGYLGNAFVLAEFRDQGVGQMLIDALLHYADDNGFARVVLSPSERSVPFYERNGFRPADALLLRRLPAR